MGPRPEDRGEEDGGEHIVGAGVASMGPRPEDRGEEDLPGEDPVGIGASMGPRPEDRGEVGAVTKIPRHGLLQWGHGPKTVESPHPARPPG